MAFPCVTIGVTTYNAEESVRDALQSALDQSVPIEQVLVIDDCSTDSTIEILAEYADQRGVEVYQNPSNRGVAVSRNEIVRRARGEFIVFFDDDDVSDPRRVELQVQRILDYEQEFANGAPVVCHTARRQIYPDGASRIEPTMGQRQGQAAPAGPAVARRALMGEPLKNAYGSCATCSQAARTDVYRELSGFDARLRRCEDTDFAIRIALVGGHFVGLPDPLVTQQMTGDPEKNLETLCTLFLAVVEKHRAVFPDERTYQFSRRWVSLKYDWLGGRRVRFLAGALSLGMRNPTLLLHRVRMALPSWSRNAKFRRFSRESG